MNPYSAWFTPLPRRPVQVAEVLTKYGEIAELSFDMNFPKAFDAVRRNCPLITANSVA